MENLVSRATLVKLAFPVGIGMAVFQCLFTSGILYLGNSILTLDFLGFAMVLTFLTVPAFRAKEGSAESRCLILADFFLALASAAVITWFVVNNGELLDERFAYTDELPDTAIWLGCALILLTMEITRRTTGLPLCIIAGAALAYFLLGDRLPPMLSHPESTLENLVDCMVIQTDGILGPALQLSCVVLFAFTLFGAFLERSGMSSIFMDLACALTRKSRGGPAKVAIFASALFGTVSGSSAGNVYTTGVFTIPLMKRCGYSPEFAGAVEAVASTGGQLMPPVMGVAAFILAELADTTYLTVAKCALLPAILYYLALYVMIHMEARKNGLGYMDPAYVKRMSDIAGRLYFLLPLAVLIYMIAAGWGVTLCANMATLSVIILSCLRRDTRFTSRRFLGSLYLASRNSLLIVACCACSGIVVGTITYTGIGLKFLECVTMLAGSNLLLLLLIIMAVSFILGMGMPTVPAYIIVATLAAPALIRMGVPVVVSHLFVFYYAVLSFITPPVCLAAYAGAAIAGSSPMRTGFTAMKLGLVAFILPIFFVYEPALLLVGNAGDIVLAALTAIAGTIGLSGALQGWCLRPCAFWERGLLLASGLCLIFPGPETDLAGAACLAIVTAEQFFRNRMAAGGAASAMQESQ